LGAKDALREAGDAGFDSPALISFVTGATVPAANRRVATVATGWCTSDTAVNPEVYRVVASALAAAQLSAS
jgi:hypothetical protein